MDIILDANSYIQVLRIYGKGFLQTNRFIELLTYLRRTGSRLIIPELTHDEVVARHRDRIKEVVNSARRAWCSMRQLGIMRIDFPEPDIEVELLAIGELLRNPIQGVKSVIYSDYSGAHVKEIVRRGIDRVRPANEAGEELRDVILWLIALHHAKQSKAPLAFISDDKTFRDADDKLHPSLQADIEKAGVEIAFYRFVGDFVKSNALDSEPVEGKALANLISDEELKRISTAQLFVLRLWDGTITAAEVSKCEIVEAKRYRVADDSYYVEAKCKGEGTIRILRAMTNWLRVQSGGWGGPHMTNAVVTSNFQIPATAESSLFVGLPSYNEIAAPSGQIEASTLLTTSAFLPPIENSYGCNFNLRLSLRTTGGVRESLEVDELVLLGELTPVADTIP